MHSFEVPGHRLNLSEVNLRFRSACFTENVFVLAIADDERALAVALGLDELEPAAGWIDGDERDGPVIVLTRGNGALPSAEIRRKCWRPGARL